MENIRIHFIVPAGGSGQRFGGKKQFMEILGVPVIERTIYSIIEACEKINASPRIKEWDGFLELISIILCLPKEDLDFGHALVKTFDQEEFPKMDIVEGGPNRGESVLHGAKRLRAEYLRIGDLVAVHDGVRPFLTPQLLSRLLFGMIESNSTCVIPGLPMTDTVKRVDIPLDKTEKLNQEKTCLRRSHVEETLDRKRLIAVQTPQVFRYEGFNRAYPEELEISDMESQCSSMTDDSSLIEDDHQVLVVAGEKINIKITEPLDKEIAELIMNKYGYK